MVDAENITSSLALDDISSPPTSSSEHTSNGSKASTPDTEHEDIPPTAPPNMEEEIVFRPYAIEEPEDEAIADMQPPELACLPDNLERWQRDLVGYIDDMGNIHSSFPLERSHHGSLRGQKRKTGNAASTSGYRAAHSQLKHPRSGDQFLSAQNPGLSPKRRRRRSKLPGDTTQPSQLASLYDFRDPRADESSGSEMRSSDESADSSPENAVTDDMDID